MMINNVVNFELQEKQSICWTSPATEILYGGSAGGGKSHAMRIIAIMLAFSVPNIQIYLFRRVFADLLKNHVEGSSGFRALLSPWIREKVVKITEEEISFQNGSKIYLCHCQHEKDVYKYQGAEMQVILIDELTHFSEKIYKFLRGRARLGGVEVPKHLKHKLPLILCGSNPGGIGHEFVKQMFIDNCKPLELRKMSVEDGGMIRQYIPARLSDNEVLMKNDPHYADKLQGLGGALAKAMLDGDWDSIDGAYFDNFDKTKHIIEPFFIPPEWFKIRAFDWGYSKPFCVLWGAVSDGSLVDCGGIKRSFPRGAIIIYREFYGCTGKANEGLKMHAGEIAKETKEMQIGEKMNDMVADPAIFDVSTGESISEQMSKEKIYWRPADNKRVAGWQQIRARFGGQDDKPLLYFFNSCKNLIRTLPIMQYDNSKPEDLNSDLEDHACFIAGTMVDTDQGKVQIEKLDPNIHKILAGNEWTNNYYPALTKKKAKTIRLTFENGVIVTCTPKHKILDITDTWRYAKDFNNQLALWNQKSSVKQSKNIKVKTITSAVITTKREALDFIAWFGKTLTVRYLKIATSITKTKIEQIINYQILNVYRSPNIQKNMTVRTEKKLAGAALKKLLKLRYFGTRAMRAGSGIKNIGKEIVKKFLPKNLLQRIARIAQKNILPHKIVSIKASSADLIVEPVRCVSVEDWSEQAVYCLFEPKTNSFTIEGGLIVHNCDTLRYLCMSRPIVVEVPKSQMALEEQWYKDFNPKNYAMNRK